MRNCFLFFSTAPPPAASQFSLCSCTVELRGMRFCVFHLISNFKCNLPLERQNAVRRAIEKSRSLHRSVNEMSSTCAERYFERYYDRGTRKIIVSNIEYRHLHHPSNYHDSTATKVRVLLFLTMRLYIKVSKLLIVDGRCCRAVFRNAFGGPRPSNGSISLHARRWKTIEQCWERKSNGETIRSPFSSLSSLSSVVVYDLRRAGGVGAVNRSVRSRNIFCFFALCILRHRAISNHLPIVEYHVTLYRSCYFICSYFIVCVCPFAARYSQLGTRRFPLAVARIHVQQVRGDDACSITHKRTLRTNLFYASAWLP